MFCNTIDLYDYFKLDRGGRSGGYLTEYAHSADTEMRQRIRPALLVIPGGGYEMLSEREREPVAFRFFNEGYSAFALTYSIKTPYPYPLIEAAMAMAYLRENAELYHIDPAHIAAVGFSAGGHLTGMLGTLFSEKVIREALGAERAKLVRPDAIILSYAVTSLLPNLTHEGTARVITGGDKKLAKRLSLDTCVTKDSSPAFIWQTAGDFLPVRHAVGMAEAYAEAGVSYELHIFEKGGHGLSVATLDVVDEENLSSVCHVQAWPTLAIAWLNQRGFRVKTK